MEYETHVPNGFLQTPELPLHGAVVINVEIQLEQASCDKI